MIKIAVDGPSGAGKSSLAKAVAAKMNIVYVDTGALYRSIGLYIRRKDISPDDTATVINELPNISLDLRFENGEQHVMLCDEDVNGLIRTPEISMYASKVSAIPEVRAFLLDTQRSIAKTNDVIMDGRDIGTVIFPDADVKIFLTASIEARAKRRYEELKEKGIETTVEDVLNDMKTRDENDSTRSVAPAVAAKDAIILDNSDLSVEQTIDEAIRIINENTHKTTEQTRFYRHFYNFFHRIFKFCMHLRTTGYENVPEYNGCVVCANHVGLLDVLAISACFPRERRLRYLAKAELFKIPLLKTLIIALGACKLDRGGSDIGAIKKSVSLIKSGELVAVFPQGTRQKGKNPAETPIKSGAGMIAYHAKAPMLPVCVKMKKQKYLLFFRRVDIIIGKPIPYSELGFEKGGGAEYKAATEKVYAEICKLGGFTADISDCEDKSAE